MFRHRVAALQKLLKKAARISNTNINLPARTSAVNGCLGHRLLQPSSFLAPRFYCGNHNPSANPVTLQMIDYALGLARSQKTGLFILSLQLRYRFNFNFLFL